MYTANSDHRTPPSRSRAGKVHERVAPLMQIDEDKSAPCINELPALVALGPHLHGESDDSLVGPAPRTPSQD
jgi:hypothetical protein